MTKDPEPGPDEIVLSASAEGELCNSLEHRRAGRPARVRATFGELGMRSTCVLWPECWHRSYPLCPLCWQAIREVAGQRRPALVIRGITGPPAVTNNGSGT